MNNSFHNPYHFVPLLPDGSTDHWCDQAAPYLGRNPQLEGGHGRWSRDRHHGRICCTLTLQTPLFIGAQRYQEASDREPARIAPYELDGQPALPATSLRGMISSLAEAASQSALRVLDGRRPMSYRATTSQALKKLGMVIEKDGEWRLLDLPLRDRHKLKYDETFQLDGQPTSLKKMVDEGADFSAWYYRDSNGQYFTRPKGKNRIKGKFRVMNAEKRRFPDHRKHRDFFIEVPSQGHQYDLPSQVIDSFHDMCDEIDSRANKPGTQPLQLLPYHPLGTSRNPDPKRHGNRIRVKPGDILFYSLKGNVVDFIAISAIWRKNAGPLKAFLPNNELLPFNEQRARLSPAERIFGFVQERAEDQKQNRAAAAYAGHVRFTEGRWDGWLPEDADSPYLPEVPLKILDTPKPPSPALYFRPAGGKGPIAKTALTPGMHHPQGRKFYLHKQKDDPEPWRTHHEDQRCKQKSCITPLRDGLRFNFEVEYDNLTDFELGMLLYALSPGKGFQHKLGMGKPLGLGSVEITIDNVYAQDRLARYRDYAPFTTPETSTPDWQAIRDAFQTAMNEIAPKTLKAIAMLGDPGKVTEPVHYPQVANQDTETENYRWWVANDKLGDHAQYLEPLPTTDGRLPTLLRLLEQKQQESRSGKKTAKKRSNSKRKKSTSSKGRHPHRQNDKH